MKRTNISHKNLRETESVEPAAPDRLGHSLPIATKEKTDEQSGGSRAIQGRIAS